MLSWLEAAILGAIQGLTEFLPVSSSGHLVLAQKLFGLHEPPLFYDVILHVATLVATVWVLFPQVASLARATFRLPTFLGAWLRNRREAVDTDPEAWTVLLMLLSTAITGAIGVAFHDIFEDTFSSMPLLSVGWILSGLILFATRNASLKGGREAKDATFMDAIVIGLAQAAAILPSLSRSGTTIAAALFLGLNRRFGGEFSFLLAIPTIAGAAILESRKGFEGLNVALAPATLGFLLSLLFGAISLKLLLGWIRSGKLTYFAYYCWGMAVVSGFLALR